MPEVEAAAELGCMRWAVGSHTRSSPCAVHLPSLRLSLTNGCFPVTKTEGVNTYHQACLKKGGKRSGWTHEPRYLPHASSDFPVVFLVLPGSS